MLAWEDAPHDAVPAPEATTTSREFTTIGVVGLGTMGAGIAEVFARNGIEVVGVEVDDDGLDRGRQHLRALHRPRGHARQAERARTSGTLIDRVTFTTVLKDLADADFVVEAVVGVRRAQEVDLPRPRGRS